MIRAVWRDLRPLLPPGGRRRAAVVAAESVVAGVLEALLLVLVVASAVAVADGGRTVSPSLPVVGSRDWPLAGPLAAAGAAGVLVALLHLHLARLTASLSAAVLEQARERIVTAYSGAGWPRQADEREGALQESLSTLARQSAGLVLSLAGLASGALGLAAILLAALLVDALVTLAVVACGALLFVALRPVGRRTRRESERFVASHNDFVEELAQWSTLAMDLRVFGVERAEAARLLDRNRSTASSLARLQFLSRAGAGLYRDLAVLFLVVAVAGLALVEAADVVVVGSVVLLVVRSLVYAQAVNASLQAVEELRPHLDLLGDRLASLEVAAERFGDRPLDDVREVVLDDVGYDYGPGRPGIDGVSLHIRGGEVLGVVGPSGGGKSTLVQVLLRLRTPTRGTVTVSGVRYEEIDPASWHRLVALVPQEPRLFRGTVADNIAFLRPGIGRARVEEAAAAAHVADDVRRLPDGFDTELGPRGTGLSGGQKQRIAIARALAGDPRLLVLDEPTSALDARSEQLFLQTLEELASRMTLVIIAHRLTTLARCDRVVAMEGGRVTMVGTLEEAMAGTTTIEAAP